MGVPYARLPKVPEGVQDYCVMKISPEFFALRFRQEVFSTSRKGGPRYGIRSADNVTTAREKVLLECPYASEPISVAKNGK